VPQPQYMHRGYTMHEMLDEFGLINMNGRCYDPVVGRFLSPDIIVQNPNNTQCYNRYSYAINNPMKYSDPSGWSYETLDQWHDNAQRAASLEMQMAGKRLWREMNLMPVRGIRNLIGGNRLQMGGNADGENWGTIGDIVEMLKMLKKTGLAGLLGNPGGGDTPEYDYSEGIDFTSGDGWPPDEAINYAPWRPTQNQNNNQNNNSNNKNNLQTNKGVDLVSAEFNLTSVFVAGATMSKTMNYLLNGDSKGFHKTTTEMQDRFGLNIDWGFQISIAKYMGSDNLTENSLTGKIYQLSLGSIGISYSFQPKTHQCQWFGITYSFGFGFGASWGYGRVINTWWD